MRHDSHNDSRRHLSVEEIDHLNDIDHEIGCGCPDCRPDMHDEIARCARAEEAA